MKIGFLDTSPWDYQIETVYEKPMGGSQSALCYLAEALAQLGHEIFLFNNIQVSTQSRGVFCVPRVRTDFNLQLARSLDVLIILNNANLIRDLRSDLGEKVRLILWMQQAPYLPEMKGLMDAQECNLYDQIIFVSDWQRQQFYRQFAMETHRSSVIRNAVAPCFIDSFLKTTSIGLKKSMPPILAYTSTPYRGLDILLKVFPKIRQAIPGTRLKVFSSLKVYNIAEQQDQENFGKLYQQCRAIEGVELIGSVSQLELAAQLRQVSVWPYPNTFPETSCIAALEAMASGCRIVTSHLAALPETTAGFARLISMENVKTVATTHHWECADRKDWQLYMNRFQEETIRVLKASLKSAAETDAFLRQQVDYIIQNYQWSIRGREWVEFLTTLGDLSGKIKNFNRVNLESNPRNFWDLMAFNPSQKRDINPDELLQKAELYYQQQQLDAAIQCCHEILKNQPNFVAAYKTLGNSLQAQNKLDAAIRAYQKALSLQPDFAAALANLGCIYYQQGHLELALQFFQKAITLEPELTLAYFNLGNVWSQQGNWDEAIVCYQTVIKQQPNFALAYNKLGIAWYQKKQFKAAIHEFTTATQLQPDFTEARDNLWASLINFGVELQSQNQVEMAMDCWQAALAIKSSDGIKVRLATLLPRVYKSLEDLQQWRQRLIQGITTLLQQPLNLKDPFKEVNATIFLLEYQGLNDKEVHCQLAQLYRPFLPETLAKFPQTASTAWDHTQSFKGLPNRQTPPTGMLHLSNIHRKNQTPQGQIKIGFISCYFYYHSVGLSYSRLIQQIPRDIFQVILLDGPSHHTDHLTEQLKHSVDVYIKLPNDLDLARPIIAEQNLDILVYTDIGTDPFTYFLAFTRLAAIQCALTGIPVTTGIPTMDYYISSELMEIETAQEHYSETLIKLKGLPVDYEKPPFPNPPKSRADFGLSDHKTLYLCPMTIVKFHPDFDAALAGILRHDPQGEIILFQYWNTDWHQQLIERFKQTLPDVLDRVRFLPWVLPIDLMNLLNLADVVLDTFHFSGLNTAMMVLAMGTPMVTWPSPYLRGRFCGGLYRRMGMMDCVAATQEDYVKIAVKLGTNSAYRQHIKEKILQNHAILYYNNECVAEMVEFFCNVML